MDDYTHKQHEMLAKALEEYEQNHAQDLKNYLKGRKKYLEQIIDADPSEDCISTMGQLHELNHIILWIEEHEEKEATPCND